MAATKPPQIVAPVVAYPSTWRLAGPSARESEPYADSSRWGALIAERKGVGSNALRCVANELALFALAQERMPAEPLRRAMIGRCDAFVEARIESLSAQVGVDADEEKIFAHFAPEIRARLAKVDGKVGLAFARKSGRAVVVWAWGKPTTALDASSSVIAADHSVTVRGTIGDPSLRLRTFVNQGTLGVAECAPIAETSPRFAMLPGDHAAWIEVVGAREGAYLGRVVASVLAHDEDPSTLEWSSKVAKGTIGANAEETAKQILGELNAIRAHVGAPPLGLETAQSKTNTALLPHLLAAERGGPGSWEKLCLGLLAGWDVEGAIISSGSFVDRGFGTATDGSSLLEAFLNEPSGRVALLDRKATRIALGVLVDPQSKSVAAAASLYKTFADDDHRERVAQMVGRIGRERAAAGLDPGVHISPLEVLDAEADRVRTEGKDPMAAFALALKNAVSRTKRSMRGVVWAVNDLDVIPLPKEILTKPNEPFAVQVTHRRVEGAAWGEWIVMLLWVE